MSGVWYGIGAYAVWGLLPIYWKTIGHVPAIQILGHRIVGSFVLLAGGVALSRQIPAFRAAAFAPRVLGLYAGAAALIAVNWFTYIWAVNAGFIVQTSLGYFITPLVSMLLGVVVLRERLRPVQWLAAGVAAAGVVYLTFGYGAFPWIALLLAVSFGVYGLVKKLAPLGSLHGLTLETGVLWLPAVALLLLVERSGEGVFLHTDPRSNLLLAGAGAVTVLPLLLFASAVRRIPLTLMGVLQYIAPTAQLLLGVFLYREPFSRPQLMGFICVWTGLAIFTVEGLASRRLGPRVPVPGGAAT